MAKETCEFATEIEKKQIFILTLHVLGYAL